MFARLRRAWKLAKDPILLDQVYAIILEQKEILEFRQKLNGRANALVNKLVPESRWDGRHDCEVVLNVNCENVMSEQEADQILKESHTENKSSKIRTIATPLGNQIALDKHNKKLS